MSQAESAASNAAPPFDSIGSGIGTPDVPLAVADLDGLHPPLVALGDVLVGGVLFVQFTSLLGLVMAAVGVAVLFGMAYGTVDDGT